jgi:diguanylate cyclase (GGDEF)-like protein/PAS domain S-box-containing protein
MENNSKIKSFFKNLLDFKGQKISLHLLSWVIICSTFFAFLVTAFQLFIDYKNDVDSINKNLQFISNSYTDTLATKAYNMDVQQLELQLQGMLKLQDIEYIEITENTYSGVIILATAGIPSINKDIEKIFRLNYPSAPATATQYATLRVIASLEGVYQRLWNKALIILFSNLIKTFLASIFIFFIFQYLIARHLINISTFTKQLDAKNLGTPLVLDRKQSGLTKKDELDQLVDSINKMQDELINGFNDVNQIDEALKNSEKRYRAIYDDNPHMLFTVSEDGKVLSINNFGIKQLGYPEDQLIGQSVLNVFHVDDKSLANNYLKECFTKPDELHQWELRKITHDGSTLWVHETVRIIIDQNGERSALIVCDDVTKRKKTEKDISNRNNQLISNQKVLFELAKIDFSRLDTPFDQILEADAKQLKVARVSVWFYNKDRTELICQSLYQAGKFNYEKVILNANDYPNYFLELKNHGFISANDANTNPSTSEFSEAYLKPLGIESMMDIPIHIQGDIVGIVCHEHIGPIREWTLEEEDFAKSISDLCALVIASSDRKQAVEKLNYQASHDALTGLINRREFEQRTEQLLKTSKMNRAEHALCFLDLDQFKIVNDTCGHIAGDEMLRQLSSVLSNGVRHRDTLARLGGDEFGILMEHCSLDDAHRVATTLKKIVQDYQFSWEDHSFKIGVSIGLVPITETTINLTTLLRDADAACYMAKDKGRNRIHVYHSEDTEMAQRHGEMQWVSRIQKALEENRFCLYAQAIEPLDKSSNKHYELLIRMIDETGNIIPPGAFLPAAERYNLTETLDCWVIENTFKLLEANPIFLNQIHFISINLSGQSLANPEVMDFIIKQLAVSQIDGKKICFEITETTAISNLMTAKRFISTLKDFGCFFALDDFGSGLSSFGYLKNLAVDYLKIDGIFVKDIVDDPIDHAMVKSINEIGQVMGMQTIAEFVENDEIKGMLREIGVNFAQGYGIEKPISFNEILNRSVNVANINKYND